MRTQTPCFLFFVISSHLANILTICQYLRRFWVICWHFASIWDTLPACRCNKPNHANLDGKFAWFLWNPKIIYKMRQSAAAACIYYPTTTITWDHIVRIWLKAREYDPLFQLEVFLKKLWRMSVSKHPSTSYLSLSL